MISLSDNPRAEFDDKHKAEIFELPLTGYDVAGRTATIALNEAQMKEKGIVAGERLMVRQVDKDGNASEAVHVHLDPAGWADRQISEPTADGSTQNVMGAEIQVNTGITGLSGHPKPGKLEVVLGKATVDSAAPKLIEGNISVASDKLTAKEVALAKALNKYFEEIGGGDGTHAEFVACHKSSESSFANQPGTMAHCNAVMPFVKDAALYNRLAVMAAAMTTVMANGGDASRLDATQLAQFLRLGSDCVTTVKFDKALEPGVTVTVQNSRTGEARTATQGADSRTAAVSFQDVKGGDPLIVTYSDAAGNPGKPYGFRYAAKAKDGKATSSVLDIRFSQFDLKPQKPARQAQA